MFPKPVGTGYQPEEDMMAHVRPEARSSPITSVHAQGREIAACELWPGSLMEPSGPFGVGG